jgi:alkaline phosphatase D
MRSPWMNRRDFLTGAGALAGLWIAGQRLSLGAAPVLSADPFTLGVASGDPLPDGVVLWTRLAPVPLKGGGMPPEPYPVEWEVAEDETMRKVVKRGTALATPALAHSVHVELRGLQPARWYWYQFRLGDYTSPVGRTRTAPASSARLERLSFAFASCSNWQHGYFAAYGAMAREDLDLVVHLGDYIYEYGPEGGGPRQHTDGAVVSTLQSYRNRYALYKTDRSLQAAHASFPWIVTWDDHEVENNYAGTVREAGAAPSGDFLARRANAYQAYYEHMPLRLSSLPSGPNMQLYRRLTFGDLAELSMLDTRQYRTDQPCGDSIKPRCAEALSESQTMTGPEQEKWLLRGLERSRARWNVIGQQTMLAQYDFHPLPNDELFSMDQWDGYVAARNRLLGFMRLRKPSNPVVLSGDIHSSWVHDLKADFADPASATVGTEFVGTSISSWFPVQYIPYVQAALPGNPHTNFFDGVHRGYVRCTVTRDQWHTDFRTVPTAPQTGSVTVQEASATTLASFVVTSGRPGAERA